MGGREKSLGEWMINAKIPRAYRDAMPLLVSPAHILWIAGGQIDERARVRPGTRRVLHAIFRRREGEH